MSGQLKEVRLRIASVKNTQQITKAMKMVAAAKLRRAQDAIVRMRPYSTKLEGILQNIVSSQDDGVEIAYAMEREVKSALIVLFTSDRGLCGGFNSNLIKTAKAAIKEQYASLNTKDIHVITVGRKGEQSFGKLDYSLDTTHTGLMSDISFANSAVVAETVMADYLAGKYDVVELVYSQFKNAASQIFTTERFLPIAKVEAKEGSSPEVDFIFEPGRKEIIESLLPKILKTQLFKALLDTNASEHGARMTAMDSATENANEMLKELRISYNRARQAAITTELTEIVAGAAALEG